MKTLKEAQQFALERLLDTDYGENLPKLNENDTGKNGWHIGKYDLIHLLAYIYDVQLKDVNLRESNETINTK